jgi:hypothetical protein
MAAQVLSIRLCDVGLAAKVLTPAVLQRALRVVPTFAAFVQSTRAVVTKCRRADKVRYVALSLPRPLR